MPRMRRLHLPGGIYHAMGRGIERRKIFLNDKDREDFLVRLEKELGDTGVQCLAWTLMPNHYHLLIRISSHSLSSLMARILTGYAVNFNGRHRRVGHVFQNRFKSILCQEEEYLLELVRYIHLNPLRAKLVPGIQELEKFPWSGHSAILGKKKREWQEVEEVLVRFGSNIKESRKKYKEFVLDGVALGKRPEFSGGGLFRSTGGWKGLRDIKKKKDKWRSDERILGDGDFVNDALQAAEEAIDQKERLLQMGWNMDKVIKNVCGSLEVDPKDLSKRGRGDNLSKAKALIAYWCNRELGISRNEIAARFGMSGSATTYKIRDGEKLVLEDNLDLLSY